MAKDYKLCDNYVHKVDDYPFCNRRATHVVLRDNIVVEYLCTQHANKCKRIGLAPNVQIIKMQGTR